MDLPNKKSGKKIFKPVPAEFDFVKNEKKILDWWYRSGVVKKYLSKNKDSKKRFSFIDGPITANNPMGVHHAWGRTLKDLYQRYKNMQGFEQRFQNGFDCQGLWVEVEVERDLGFNSKKDINKFGLDKFTQACKDRVNKFAQKQTQQSKRLGYFMDWGNSYFTMSETNNLYIWRFLKECHQKGLIYKSKSSTTWCPRCETGLSQHEQADGYQTITDLSVYVKFPLKGRKKEYLLVWTTTPWTLAANVVSAINTQFPYVKAKVDDQVFYLAKESAQRLGLKNYSPIKGKELLGWEYQIPHDHLPAQKEIKHFVVEWDLVDPSEGTGIVHVAPGCGQEDFELGQKLGIPAISPLDEAGFFKQGFAELSGQYAHKAADKVINHLKKKGLFYKSESVTHSYPHCWRCKTKCLFRLEDNWFINCQKIKKRLRKKAREANWIPSYAGKRMDNWLENMGDWMISRKRFYGLALPFYECKKCQKTTVIGSKEELKKMALEPKLVDRLPSLHRPWVDEIEIKCPNCQERIKRIPDVGDCWLDAGVVPFSTLKYFEDKKYWQKWFPADLVLEMVEQVRLWYYSMLVYGVIFEDQIPYLNVANHSEVRDEKGERMSKTKKNGIPFDQAAEKMGIDAMRWLYCQQKPDAFVKFGYSIADEVRRKFIFLFWNSYRFFVTYANLNNWQPKKGLASKNKLDQWILSRLETAKRSVEEKLDKFHHHQALKAIGKFLNDLSLWYIRRSRARTSCLPTLYYVLENLCLILAPFIPYLTETIWQGLGKKDSLHLQDWPKVNEKLIDKGLEEKMALVREITALGHGQRKTKGIKVRQPLKKIKVENGKELEKELVELLKAELNVKEIEIRTGKGELKVELETKLTPELKTEGEARELIRQIQILRQKAKLSLTDKITIFAPSWPKEWEKEILKKTGAKEIKKGKKLEIKQEN